jgi:hypothetical protein
MPENAAKFKDWLSNRGGLAVWVSVDLSDLSESWTTPVNDSTGKPVGPPNWKCGGKDTKPDRIITDINEVQVLMPKLVQRLPVALKRSGMKTFLTPASEKKLKKAVEKAGAGAWYEKGGFFEKEMLIFVPDKVVPLAEFNVESWQKSLEEGKE